MCGAFRCGGKQLSSCCSLLFIVSSEIRTVYTGRESVSSTVFLINTFEGTRAHNTRRARLRGLRHDARNDGGNSNGGLRVSIIFRVPAVLHVRAHTPAPPTWLPSQFLFRSRPRLPSLVFTHAPTMPRHSSSSRVSRRRAPGRTSEHAPPDTILLPPPHTRRVQPTLETQRKQVELWKSLILRYEV